MRTASENQHNPELWRANDGAAQTVIPGTELGLSLIRLANSQPRVPTRNPNTVRGSRERKPVENFWLTHDPLTGEAL